MNVISSLKDIEALTESFDVECKLAQGRDGKGALPDNIWETYSAFANTSGGDIFLGLKEKKDQSFELAGIEDTQKVIGELWRDINNQLKVSANILRKKWVNVLTIDNKKIIHIHVPMATEKYHPVYIRGNPLQGTYKRIKSADICQNEEVVHQMLANKD